MCYERKSRILENLVLAVIRRLGMMVGVATLDVIYTILMAIVGSQSNRGQVAVVTIRDKGSSITVTGCRDEPPFGVFKPLGIWGMANRLQSPKNKINNHKIQPDLYYGKFVEQKSYVSHRLKSWPLTQFLHSS